MQLFGFVPQKFDSKSGFIQLLLSRNGNLYLGDQEYALADVDATFLNESSNDWVFKELLIQKPKGPCECEGRD
jgi:hypothetical protein